MYTVRIRKNNDELSVETEDLDAATGLLNMLVYKESGKGRKDRASEIFIEDGEGNRVTGYDLIEMPDIPEDPERAARLNLPPKSFEVFFSPDRDAAPAKSLTARPYKDLRDAKNLAARLCGLWKDSPAAGGCILDEGGALMLEFVPADENNPPYRIYVDRKDGEGDGAYWIKRYTLREARGIAWALAEAYGCGDPRALRVRILNATDEEIERIDLTEAGGDELRGFIEFRRGDGMDSLYEAGHPE